MPQTNGTNASKNSLNQQLVLDANRNYNADTRFNASNDNNNNMELYRKRDFKSLADSDLKQPVNNDGDTIIHIMSQELDKNGIETLLMYNPYAITYEIINMPNKKSQLPIQKAMASIERVKQNTYDFITFMIRLGANPDIPDAKNRIIVPDIKNTGSVYENFPSVQEDQRKQADIEKLNNTVINNIKSLTKMIDSKSGRDDRNDTDVDFVKKIIELYKPKQGQSGGYNNKRRTNNFMDDSKDLTESGENDSFVVNDTNRKNRWIDEYDRTFTNGKIFKDQFDYSNMNDQMVVRNNKNITSKMQAENEMVGGWKLNDNELSRRESEMLRNQFLLGGMKNANYDKNNNGMYDDMNNGTKNTNRNSDTNNNRNNDMNNRYNDFLDHDINDTLVGGKKTKGKKIKSFVDDWRTDDFNFDHSTSRIDSERPNTETSELNIFDDDDEIEEEKFSDSDMDNDVYNYSNVLANQDRPRKQNTKADDIYRAFAKKIMDLLGVDEETAKFYRAALKVNIEENNPELKGRENDEVKVKEMENIFENKAKLQAALDKIDMDKIKKIMKDRKEEWERRMEERKKMGEGKKMDEGRNKPSAENRTKETSKARGKEKNYTTEKIVSTDTPKSKTKKTTRKTTDVENGYMQSDDVEFSTEY